MTAQAFIPRTDRIERLAQAAHGCHGCNLYRHAGQTVFGEGSARATMMLVGEQPGDREDRTGRPFVGPAGRLLDKALQHAGIDRDGLYVTNAVKHFKFERTRGERRRIHKTPSRTEVVACRPWLFAELAAIQPQIVVLMGATAAQSLLGGAFRLTAHRGEKLRLPDDSPAVLADASVVVTAHPSSALRGPAAECKKNFGALVADLRFASELLSA